MNVHNYVQTDFFANHTRPTGLPFVTERIVIGYAKPITDPLLWTILAEEPQGKYIEQLLIDSFHSLGGVFERSGFALKLDYLFDPDEIKEKSMEATMVHLMAWAKHLDEAIRYHGILDLYLDIRNRLFHDYACVHAEVDFLVDKCIIELHGYYPDAE